MVIWLHKAHDQRKCCTLQPWAKFEITSLRQNSYCPRLRPLAVGYDTWSSDGLFDTPFTVSGYDRHRVSLCCCGDARRDWPYATKKTVY